ncbi:coiled-coil domain-containing protein 106-like [Labeo rohita]|uniref:Coiled-coil domain-containing protein 106-like n=1 Tax=Labeo rohita TaxID=84645 RepID=A0A498L813_LABRO|nr:coiled-coil domain-containing protein 106-like [Labeo rohita]
MRNQYGTKEKSRVHTSSKGEKGIVQQQRVKGVRTRGKKNDNVEVDALEKTCISGTSGVSVAPTAHLADKNKSHELEMYKLRVEWQKDKTDELTKERDYLKEQLASAQTPQQVVSRYKKILWHFSKGGTMSAAFKHVGVDWNTVSVDAPIAELYIAAPDKFKELLKNHSSQVKLSAFATQCAAAVNEESAIEDRIKALKASGKLLPLKRK